MPPALWQAEDFAQRIEFLQSWGFNAVLLDAVTQPLTDPFHKDEDHPARWEASLAETASDLHLKGWWVMAVIPVQLDLGRQETNITGIDDSIPCRQAPLHRRRSLHRFESILKGIQGLDALGISVCEWPRCQCGNCQKVTFEEEAAYYLRAFSAVIKRYGEGLEFWVLPDLHSFSLLQEIRALVPSGARFLVEPREPGQKGELLPAQAEEGLILDLSIPSPVQWLDTNQFTGLLRDWEQEGEPRLLATIVGDRPRFPLSLAAFMRLAWRTQSWGLLPEASLYQMTLPKSQREAWKEWKHRNLSLARRIHTHTPPDSSTATEDPRPPQPADSPFQPDLTIALEQTRERLDLEDQLRPLLQRLAEIPEGIPLEPQWLGRLLEIQLALTHLTGDSPGLACLEPMEWRVLENLRDRIGLLLSETRAGLVWSPRAVPDLQIWLEILGDEE